MNPIISRLKEAIQKSQPLDELEDQIASDISKTLNEEDFYTIEISEMKKIIDKCTLTSSEVSVLFTKALKVYGNDAFSLLASYKYKENEEDGLPEIYSTCTKMVTDTFIKMYQLLKEKNSTKNESIPEIKNELVNNNISETQQKAEETEVCEKINAPQNDEYNVLLQKYNDLLQENNALTQKYKDLPKKYDELLEKYESERIKDGEVLIDWKHQYQTEIPKLESKIKELEKEIRSREQSDEISVNWEKQYQTILKMYEDSKMHNDEVEIDWEYQYKYEKKINEQLSIRMNKMIKEGIGVAHGEYVRELNEERRLNKFLRKQIETMRRLNGESVIKSDELAIDWNAQHIRDCEVSESYKRKLDAIQKMNENEIMNRDLRYEQKKKEKLEKAPKQKVVKPNDNKTMTSIVKMKDIEKLKSKLSKDNWLVYATDENDSLSILTLAYKEKWLEGFRVLAKTGAFVESVIECKDSRGTKLITKATRDGNIDYVRILIKYGANIRAEEEAGRSPLIAAVNNKNIELVKLLVSKGANMEATDSHQKTPFFLATESECFEIAEYLVGKGANVEAKDDNGNTPLLAAVSSDKIDMAMYILSIGADPHARNNSGRSSIAIAKQNMNFNMVKLLEKYSA